MSSKTHTKSVHQQLFEHAPFGILRTRPEGTILNVNPALPKMLGYDSTAQYLQLVKHNICNSYAEPKRREELIDSLLSRDLPQAFEAQIRCKDGSLLACRIHMRAHLLPDGSVDYLESFIQDMTLELEFARKLESRDAQYRSVFENTGAGTVIIEKDTTISMVNEGFAQMLGYSKEDIEGRLMLSDFIANQQDLEMMLRYHHQRRDNPREVPVEYEFKLRDKTGIIRNIWMRVDLIAGTEKSVASLMDITSFKQAKRKLLSSEAKLSGILTAFGGYAYTVSQDLHLRFANAMLREVIEEKYIGKKCYQIIFHLDKPCPWCNQEQVLKGETVNQEFLNPIDGRWYFSVASPIFGTNDNVVERQTVIVDIHKRKKAELALKEKEAHLTRENLRLRAAIKESYRFGDIIGKSEAMQKVYELILRAAETDASVIIHGESGTGKELVARAIHQLGDRGQFRFVPVNCGAIPSHLMESEFFGHKRGAFTGANNTKPGLLDHAHKGTLFLDELEEIGEDMQIKLLRALQSGDYTPIGGLEPHKSNARIISATNKPLVQLLDEGRMREDFFYRIHIFPIHLPPLRERKEDIPLLVEHFLVKYGKEKGVHSLRGQELEMLMNHHWPGNVRELENTIQRYLSLNTLDFMNFNTVSTATGDRDMPVMIRTGQRPLREIIDEMEKAYILSLLNRHQWNRTRVADILGIQRKTLYLKLKKLDIETSEQ